jgi:HK97 family phage prohead protease
VSDRFNQRAAFEVASFKANDAHKGEFEALVSVFGNVDYGGDRVVKGAFAKSLARWEEKGDPIPVIWNHMWENPEAHIGKVNPGDAVETADGLLVKGYLDMDNPFAAQVYRLLSERRVKEFSFGYNLLDSEKKSGALNLTEIDLFEVGPTLKGMNPATELLAVKALAAATDPFPG